MEELLPLVLVLIQKEPEIQAALVKLFNGTQPTPEDWQAAHDAAATETFATLAPHAAANLPAEVVTAPALPAVAVSQAAPAPAPEPPLVDDAGAADKLKMFGTSDPNNATETANGPVTDQAAAPVEAAPVQRHPIYGTPV